MVGGTAAHGGIPWSARRGTVTGGAAGSGHFFRVTEDRAGQEEASPATGGAATALAGYLGPRDATLTGTLRWIVEQGFEMKRPSILEVEVDKIASVITAIRVGGSSVRVSEGVMEIG